MKFKFKSLRSELLISFVALVATICIGISLVSLSISKNALIKTSKLFYQKLQIRALLQFKIELIPT